jgi:hypothetical protein
MARIVDVATHPNDGGHARRPHRVLPLKAAALRVVLAAALIALALAGTADAKRITARTEGVRATVSWHPARAFEARNVSLRIWRDGRLALTRKLGFARPQTLRVRDLDGNGEPEVIADFYTGGAHCCLFSRIYRWSGSAYVALRHTWGNQSYHLRDLNHDRTLELVSADDRFAYAFTSYAQSAFPIQIWDYSRGRMRDVTRGYPALIRNDAARLWKTFLVLRDTEHPDSRGILAAWMADKYVLREQTAGWKTMALLNAHGELEGSGRNDAWPKNAAYLAKLRRFLVGHGYAATR